MANRRLRLVAVVVIAIALGFLIGTLRSGVHIETGQAHSTGNGGGSIITNDWTYGFPADIAWIDTNNSWHDGGLPACLPPLSIVDGVRFAWVEASIEGTRWRPVVWIDCHSLPSPVSTDQ